MNDDKVFEIEGVEFVIDERPGTQRGKSTENRFILVKNAGCLDFYRNWDKKKPNTIMEVGMFEGGSLVMLDKIFKPRKMVGMDIREEPIQPLETYARNHSHIKTYYGSSQSDPVTLKIARENFSETGIDLVLDDASHLHDHTKATFEMLFPMVTVGGHYIIEDWAWSFGKNYQGSNAVWSNQPAMANLIFHLVALAGSTGLIRQVHVQRELVCITRGAGPVPSNLFDLSGVLRGRKFAEI